MRALIKVTSPKEQVAVFPVDLGDLDTDCAVRFVAFDNKTLLPYFAECDEKVFWVKANLSKETHIWVYYNATSPVSNSTSEIFYWSPEKVSDWDIISMDSRNVFEKVNGRFHFNTTWDTMYNENTTLVVIEPKNNTNDFFASVRIQPMSFRDPSDLVVGITSFKTPSSTQYPRGLMGYVIRYEREVFSSFIIALNYTEGRVEEAPITILPGEKVRFLFHYFIDSSKNTANLTMSVKGATFNTSLNLDQVYDERFVVKSAGSEGYIDYVFVVPNYDVDAVVQYQQVYRKELNWVLIILLAGIVALFLICLDMLEG